MHSSQKLKLRKLLAKPQQIVIVTHWSPDGDAMGSSLGLYNYLLKKKHSVNVITPNDYPDFLHWMKGHKQVTDHLRKPAKAAALVRKATLIFCLDFNNLERIAELGMLVSANAAPKVLIDHHPQPSDFAQFSLHKTTASSTCELIFDFIEQMGDKKHIDKDIANCLYAGIMTDTGSFRFPSTSAKTHRIVASLIEAGATNAFVHQAIYDDSTEDRLRLLGFSLSEKLRVLPEFQTAYITLSEQEQSRFNYRKGDTEGLVNYCLAIRGIRFAAFFAERDGTVKTSFRSKGSFDVNAFARANFRGGGHRNAAGGSSDLSLEEAEKKFTGLLPRYKKELKKP
ncbi:MAG: phosphoesterase RecJ domain-containing protein [Bacteroidetes bacterium]|nr:MAG: phosphoesterase RecJ domain-containing protein [Bacteroidota bacterium]